MRIREANLKWSPVVTRACMYARAYACIYARGQGVRGAIGRAGGVSNKLTADISVVYPAPLPSGSTSRLRASGPARERSRGEANIQRERTRARARARVPEREASVCARAGERSFLPRICKLNNKYRGIYTRKSSAFRLHAARARRGLVARPRGDGAISIRRLALLRAAGPTLYTHTRARLECTCTAEFAGRGHFCAPR